MIGFGERRRRYLVMRMDEVGLGTKNCKFTSFDFVNGGIAGTSERRCRNKRSERYRSRFYSRARGYMSQRRLTRESHNHSARLKD